MTVQLNTIDPRLRNTLEVWLKFGTVFLVYRIGKYLIFDVGRNSNPLFDIKTVQLVIFILIGFTLYYLLIKPYVPIPGFDNIIMRNVVNDVLMFGTVIVVTHFLDSYMTNSPYFTERWIKSSTIILLSFIIYDVMINPVIPKDCVSLRNIPMMDTVTKYGFFLIVLRLLEGKDMFDIQWITSVILVCLGFIVYFKGTKKLITVVY